MVWIASQSSYSSRLNGIRGWWLLIWRSLVAFYSCIQPWFVFCSAGVWSYLQGTLLRRYAEENNGINVLTGPIFDFNYDGLRDTTEKIKEWVWSAVIFSFLIDECTLHQTTANFMKYRAALLFMDLWPPSRFSADGPLVPTHFYTVVTSCQEVNQTVEECDGALRVFSLLLTHRPDNSEACNVSLPAEGSAVPPLPAAGYLRGWAEETEL